MALGINGIDFSIPAIIEINKKNYRGVLEADEKGLYFLSNDGQNCFSYLVDWESVEYSRSEEKIRKLLFITVSMIRLSITSSLGSLPKILVEEKEYERFIKGFKTIKDCIEDHKQALKRTEEFNRIKKEIEERRRQIRLQLVNEKKERHIRLNNLLAQAKKECLRKEEKKREAITRFIILLSEESNRRQKQNSLENFTKVLQLVLEAKTEEERRRLLEEQQREEERRRLLEEQRREEERRRLLEERRREEHRRLLEEKYREEHQRLLKKQRLEEERRRLLEAHRREADSRRLLEEQRRKEEERKRFQEEQRRKEEECRRFTEEQHRKEEEYERLFEEYCWKEEESRSLIEEQRRKEEECQRLCEEQLEKEEGHRSLVEEYRKQDKERLGFYKEQRQELFEEQRRQGMERLRLLEEQRRKGENRKKRLSETNKQKEEHRISIEEQCQKEEERRSNLEEQHQKEEERKRVLEEQRRKEEERRRILEEKHNKEERKRLLEEQCRQEKKHFAEIKEHDRYQIQHRSNCSTGYKETYQTIVDSGVTPDDDLVSAIEAEVSNWEYENGKYVYKYDNSLSDELHDFFCAYVLFQHNKDGLQFQFAYETIYTVLMYYNINNYLKTALANVTEKAIYDFQFDNEMMLRILVEISNDCFLSSPSNNEDEASFDSAIISHKQLIKFVNEKSNNSSESRELKAQIKEIESQYYELEFGKWRREKYERIHNYYNELAEGVIGYIEKQSSPISLYKLKEVFKGLKKNTMVIVLNESSIVDLGNRYISTNALHIDTRTLNDWERIIRKTIMNSIEPPHIRLIYNAISAYYSSILQRNYITEANQLFSLLSKLFEDEFNFKRPYIGLKHQDIISVKDRIINYISGKDEIEIEEIQQYARDNYLHIGSLLKLFNSLSEYVLLKNKKTLISNYKLVLYGVSPYLILDKIQKELSSGKGYKAIRDLECISEFPNTSIKWDEWLIYSIVDKYSSAINALTTSKQFKSAIPVVSLSPKLSQKSLKQIADRYAGLENITFDKEVDDLDNLDELIEDYIDLDDIDDLDDFNIDDGEFI